MDHGSHRQLSFGDFFVAVLPIVLLGDLGEEVGNGLERFLGGATDLRLILLNNNSVGFDLLFGRLNNSVV